MSNHITTLPSGATFEVQMAPFAIGSKVYKVIANELKAVDFSDLDLSDGVSANSLKGALFQLLGSEAVEAVVFEVFKHCLYRGGKIDRSTFEPAEARQDFFPAAWEAIAFNASPFFKSLGSLLSGLGKPTSGAQK